jgi:shikimate kinase
MNTECEISNVKNKIYLIGFMGCGKTVYGKLLSEILEILFFDLDDYIEKEQKKSISQIFAANGEREFRQYEQSALRQITEHNKHFVLASGGGTPCFAENMQYMNLHGITVYLKCTVNELYENILLSNPDRPLLQGKRGNELRKHISQLLAIREPFYNQAKIILTSNEHNPEKIAKTINNYYIITN